jgi:drug/metabolite transporter (DMT)-like permease
LDSSVFVAMIASAFLHACWNAWVKSRPEPNEALAAVVICSGVPQAVLMVAAGLPAAAAWPWIAVTVLISIVALLLLGSAYRQGDFTVAYPLIRGLVPLVLTLAAVPLFDERPTATAILGVISVSAGLALLAWESARRTQTMTLRGLGFASLAAGVTAASVLTDTTGARASGNPVGYAAMISVLNAGLMAGVYRVQGYDVSSMVGRHWQVAAGGALLASASYVLFIWSVMRAPVAVVVALRETSMLFAVIIAIVMLRERVGRLRGVAIAVLFGGAILLRL